MEKLFCLVTIFLLFSLSATKSVTVDFTKQNKKDASREVAIQLGDTLQIKIESNPTTGYSWYFVPDHKANCISKVKLRGEYYQVPGGQVRMGQGGEVTFTFDAIIKGTQLIQMAYNRGPVSSQKLDDIQDNFKKLVIVNIHEKSKACGAITYGRVFKAKHNQTNQIVAIKKFKQSDDDQHIIHRDIKPENLLLSKNGVLKICDFGFARVIGGPQSVYTDYVSTRWYRAPELLVGDVQYGKAVDVWAIGCQVVQFMTGYPLFPGESDIHTLYYIMKTLGDSLTSKQREAFDTNSLFQGVKLPQVHDLQSLEMKFPTFDSKTIDFIRKCLELDPTNRRSCEELKSHPYFDNFRDQIQLQLKESVKKDEYQFQFKALQAMQSVAAIQNTLIAQDYKKYEGDDNVNDNDEQDEQDEQQVERIDNFINNNGLTNNNQDNKKFQKSKVFGVQEQAVFGGSNSSMFLVPEFGKGLSQKKGKDHNGFGAFPINSLAKKINYPQIYGSGSLFDTSSIQQHQYLQSKLQQQEQNIEAEQTEVFRFKELIGNMCTSGTYILGKDRQILNSSQDNKVMVQQKFHSIRA